MAEINVTPFVDVMLVLLIVFMLAISLDRSNSRGAPPPNNISVRGNNFYIESSEPKSKTPEFRNGASHRLVINGTQLVSVGSLDVASEDWKQIHSAVEKLRETRGFNGLLHIQYFFERGTQPKRLRETKVATKIALADIDLYISCIDGHYRGDEAKWENSENEVDQSKIQAADQNAVTTPAIQD